MDDREINLTDDDFEERVENTADENRASTNFLGHLNTVSNELNRTLDTLSSQPQNARRLGQELSRSFLYDVRHSQTNRGRRPARQKLDKRRMTHLQAYLTCLNDPSTDRVNNINFNFLTTLGLGVPEIERAQLQYGIGRQRSHLSLQWTDIEFREYLHSCFPALKGHSYEILYSGRGGLLHSIPQQINTPDGIRVYLENVRKGSQISLFIRPDKLVNKLEENASPSDPSRRHVSFAVGSPSQGMQSEHRDRPNTSPRRPSRSRVSSALGSPSQGIQLNNTASSAATSSPRHRRALSTVIQGMETDHMEEALPRIERRTSVQRRMAARVARTNIRGWCNRSPEFTAVNSSQASQSEETNNASIKLRMEMGNVSKRQQPDQRKKNKKTTTAEGHQQDNTVDNLGLSITELRAIQDEEYASSLVVDQKKDREKNQENERLENERLQQQNELEEIHQNMRRDSLQLEPLEGIVLKIRNGDKRTFLETDSIQEVVNFVGSQPNSSINFEVTVAGISKKINTWDSSGSLKDFGIVHSAILEVEFHIERPVVSHSAIRTYTDLISSLNEGNDGERTDEQEDNEEEIIDVPRRENDTCENLRDLLLSWRLRIIDLDNCQDIKVSRRPEALWKHSVRCFRRSSFNLKKMLKVEFINESGLDEGGLRRDYLEMLFQQMLLSPLLEDNGNGYEVSYNFGALSDDSLNFELLGKMLATILIQGGPVLPTFSHTMIAYGIQGMQCATIETVKDTKTKTIIENLINSDDMTKLADAEAINNLMAEAGISLRLNENTKNGILKGLIMHGSTVTKKQAMYEQFWKGAEHLSLRKLLIENQGQLEKILCHKCGSTEPLRAENLVKLFDISKYGRRGSNNRHRSEEVAQNFESFVFDCEDGKCCYADGSVTIEDVLKFVTGCSNVPPGGFDARFILGFTEEKRYPSVSTCTFEVTLPLNITEFQRFKAVMIEAIVSGPGFGQV